MNIDRGLEAVAHHGIPRSPHWSTVRKAHLKLQPYCVACGEEVAHANLQVHHIFPFHYCVALGRPDLELDQRNLITLDEHPGTDHHLLIGHLDDFKSSNLNVGEDAQCTYKALAADKIKTDLRWVAQLKTKLKPLDEMTQSERDELRAMMDQKIPLAAAPEAMSCAR